MSTFQPDLIVPEPWYGFDFNRTLAVYHSYDDDMSQAAPIPSMVALVQRYLAEGRKVKILSAQVWRPPVRRAFAATPKYKAWLEEARGYWARATKAEATIKAWCLRHIGQELEVTCERDPGCQEIWDDKARQVVANTGFVPYLSVQPHPFVYLRLTYHSDHLLPEHRALTPQPSPEHPTHHPNPATDFAVQPEQSQAAGRVAPSQADDAGHSAPPTEL